jgi:hypothetical protein
LLCVRYLAWNLSPRTSLDRPSRSRATLSRNQTNVIIGHWVQQDACTNSRAHAVPSVSRSKVFLPNPDLPCWIWRSLVRSPSVGKLSILRTRQTLGGCLECNNKNGLTRLETRSKHRWPLNLNGEHSSHCKLTLICSQSHSAHPTTAIRLTDRPLADMGELDHTASDVVSHHFDHHN